MSKSLLPHAHELRQVVDCVSRLAEVADVHDYYRHAVEAMADLLPGVNPSCELIAMDPPSMLAGYTSYLQDPKQHRAGMELLPTHPLLAAWLKIDGDGLLWTGPSQQGGVPMAHTRIYLELLQPLGITHQVLPSVRIDADRALTMMMSSDQPIGPRQRHVIDMIRPAMRATFRCWEAIREVRGRKVLTPASLAKRFNLPPRRAEVLCHMTFGMTNRQIAEAMDLKIGTIRKHVELLLSDLGIDRRSEALAMVHRAFEV